MKTSPVSYLFKLLKGVEVIGVSCCCSIAIVDSYFLFLFKSKTMRAFYKLFLCSVLLFVFASCKKNNEEPGVANRTVMVYIGANNNLVSDAYNSINKMEEALSTLAADVIVYAQLAGTSPKIYRIKADRSPAIMSTVLKTYNQHNSADPVVMADVLKTMQSYVQGSSSGLILWSHASNWLPETTIKLRSFNNDNGSQIDLIDMEKIIPSGLDFLMFDACSMASVEVLYDLRQKAKYAIASPTEVLSSGMPYDLVLSDLVNDDLESGLKNATRKYYEYYLAQAGDYQSASISVINNANWDQVVRENKKLVESKPFITVDRANLQRLDFDPSSLSVGYDYLDFMEQQYQDISQLRIAIANLVAYKAYTPQFLGKPIRTFSGLSCYVPVAANKWVHEYYRRLSWTKSSGFDLFFTQNVGL